MFGIAYRMLGTVSDAEDIVQDAWIRWQSVNSPVDDPAAYLATIVTRLALTSLDTARARRETYVGPWLPEPVDTTNDPTLGAENQEALSLAVLLLLERLSPAERAAFVLHEAFAYPFAQIGEILQVTDAAARQLASRARKHLDRSRPTPATPAQRERLLAALTAAANNGDLAALEEVLTADVAATSDGGGIVLAARKVSRGPERVATFVLGVLERFTDGMVPRVVEVNGEPAFAGVRDGRVMAVWSVDAAASGISQIFIVLNPQKLSRF
jgi:RNA polymerase sigma-70 factor (ECF subfamily)